MPKRQMLINYVPGEECRIAITEDGRLEELYQERASSESHVGNIYKGKVTNVEPSIQAAFIEFGLERNGFLHISDLHPMYFPGDAKEDTEQVGLKTPRRDRPPIQKCLRRGQEILVQILKEGIGTKGPTLTSYLSIPGRYLVMMPNMERMGVSRKVDNDQARRAMREILDQLRPPEGFGFIIRTAGIGRTRIELKRDLAYLLRMWRSIEARMKNVRVGELFAESDLVIRTIRDIYSADVERIIIDDASAALRARDFLAIASPGADANVYVYKDPIPLFHRYDIDRQIETINSRVVPLPSGGSLIIESTEALVAIDVNSGKNRDNRDADMTAYRVNMEAADEICRQIRLRDLGGVIVNDLIDMRNPRHRRDVENKFKDNLKRDRARTRTHPISQFGILEMTRQRMRPSLHKSIYADCPSCRGMGNVKSPESVVLDVMRRLALVLHRDLVARVDLTVSGDVAFHLLNRKRGQLVEIERTFDKPVTVRVNGAGAFDEVNIIGYDARNNMLDLAHAIAFKEPLIERVEPMSAEALAELGVNQDLFAEEPEDAAVITDETEIEDNDTSDLDRIDGEIGDEADVAIGDEAADASAESGAAGEGVDAEAIDSSLDAADAAAEGALTDDSVDEGEAPQRAYSPDEPHEPVAEHDHGHDHSHEPVRTAPEREPRNRDRNRDRDRHRNPRHSQQRPDAGAVGHGPDQSAPAPDAQVSASEPVDAASAQTPEAQIDRPNVGEDGEVRTGRRRRGRRGGRGRNRRGNNAENAPQGQSAEQTEGGDPQVDGTNIATGESEATGTDDHSQDPIDAPPRPLVAGDESDIPDDIGNRIDTPPPKSPISIKGYTGYRSAKPSSAPVQEFSDLPVTDEDRPEPGNEKPPQVDDDAFNPDDEPNGNIKPPPDPDEDAGAGPGLFDQDPSAGELGDQGEQGEGTGKRRRRRRGRRGRGGKDRDESRPADAQGDAEAPARPKPVKPEQSSRPGRGPKPQGTGSQGGPQTGSNVDAPKDRPARAPRPAAEPITEVAAPVPTPAVEAPTTPPRPSLGKPGAVARVFSGGASTLTTGKLIVAAPPPVPAPRPTSAKGYSGYRSLKKKDPVVGEAAAPAPESATQAAAQATAAPEVPAGQSSTPEAPAAVAAPTE